MSLADFKAYKETFYLLYSQNNADRLNKAIDELRSGGNKEHQLFSKENNDKTLVCGGLASFLNAH